MTHVRTQRARALSLALLGSLALGLVPVASAQAAEGEIMSEETIKWDSASTVPLPGVPANATSVKLALTGEYAWKPTRLSVCAGTTVTDSCTSSVALQLPVQDAATQTVTVPLPAGTDDVTVYNADASARVSVDVIGYSTAATPAPAPAPAPTTGPAGPATTGVPDGTNLTIYQGDLYVTEPGAVIDAMDIRGIVRIKASGVVIKRSIIRGRPLTGNMGLITNDLGKYSFTVQDSSIIAAQKSPWSSGIIGHNFTVKRTEIANVIDSVHVTGSNVRIEGSWFHSNLFYSQDPNQNGGPSHADSIQIQGGSNLRIINNRIDGAYSSAIQTTQDRGQVSDVVIQGNRIGGGGCSINVAFDKSRPVTGFAVKDNVFSRDTRLVGCAVVASTPSAISASGNTYTDGAKVSVSRG